MQSRFCVVKPVEGTLNCLLRWNRVPWQTSPSKFLNQRAFLFKFFEQKVSYVYVFPAARIWDYKKGRQLEGVPFSKTDPFLHIVHLCVPPPPPILVETLDRDLPAGSARCDWKPAGLRLELCGKVLCNGCRCDVCVWRVRVCQTPHRRTKQTHRLRVAHRVCSRTICLKIG